MSRKRFIVECIWSGYRSGQERPCHRMVETLSYRIEALKKVHTIAFTDNTTMSVDVRPCAPREKVQQINGYRSLLDKIIHQKLEGFISVRQVND